MHSITEKKQQMFNNINRADLVDASDEDVLAAMGGPSSKGTGKSATVPSKKTDDGKTSGKSNGKLNPSTPVPKNEVSDIEDEDLDSAFANDNDDNDDDDDSDEQTPPAKKKSVKKKEETVEDDENEDDTSDEDDDETGDDDQDDDSNEDDEEENDDDDQPVTVSDFLKARVNLLIQKGEWSAFEKDGKKPEDLEWTEELFEEVELQQRAAYKEGLREEILDNFGPYGREIATYAENGGNPDDLIDIFKEEQAVKAVDISTEDGQREMVFQYLTKIVGRSAIKANKDIERFIADKELADEAKEAKEKIESQLKTEKDQLIADQEAAKEEHENRLKAQQAKFSSDVTKLVNEDDDIPADEKKQIIKMLTTFKKTLPNGSKVNDFYDVMLEFRKSLPNYIKMVRLVLNPTKFEKTIKNKGKTEQAEKSFKLARGAAASKKAKPSTEFDGNRTTKKTTGFRLI